MITLKGVFKKYIFKNTDNGYVIGLFRIKEITKDEEINLDEIPATITFTGYFHELTEDDNYNLNGKFVNHAKYGLQFQVDSYERLLPKDTDATV